MDRKVYAIFVAGGSGTRMGGDTPKQFLPLAGRPVLVRTISRFAEAVPEAHIITVLPSHLSERWKEMCIEYQLTVPQTIVPGGLTRFHSVRNALVKVPDGAVVSVHDGVRPLVSVRLIRAMLERMKTVEALIPVVPVVDTLRCVDPSNPAPDRSSLLAVQTPQMFLSEVLKDAYRQAYDLSFTDDASVVERNGTSVSIIEGERLNIKITTPEDMTLAEAVLSL